MSKTVQIGVKEAKRSCARAFKAQRLHIQETSEQVSPKGTSFGASFAPPINSFEGRLQRGTISP
jgi:hypothetical protein